MKHEDDEDTTDMQVIEITTCRTCGKELKDAKYVIYHQLDGSEDKQRYCDEFCLKWRHIDPDKMLNYERRVILPKYKGKC